MRVSLTELYINPEPSPPRIQSLMSPYASVCISIYQATAAAAAAEVALEATVKANTAAAAAAEIFAEVVRLRCVPITEKE